MTQAWEVFRFELVYQIRRASTLIYVAIFVALSLALTQVVVLDARNDGYAFNAPMVTALMTILASMIALLVIAGVAGDAATRDVQERMDALLYTTPLRKRAYLGGRFAGAFVIAALLLLIIPLGLLAATYLPGVRPLGPFRGAGYLTAYFGFGLPNVFVATAVLFSIAALSRRAVAAYGGAAFLFFSALFSQGFIAGALGNWRLAKLLDPLGFTGMFALWASTNALQKNTQLVGFEPELVANRLFWLALAIVVLAFAWMQFRFDAVPRSASVPRYLGRTTSTTPEAPRHRGTEAPPAKRVFNTPTRLHQLRAVVSDSFRHVVAGRGWWIVPIAAIVFIVTAPELLEVELGTPGAATSARVASILGHFELAMIIALLAVLYAGELVWRERDARMDAMRDVTPLPEWISLTGKFLGLAMLLAAAQAIFLVAGVVVQWMNGNSAIELGVYVKVLFGIQLVDHLLTAALAMFVHVVVNQKYVGNVVALLAFVTTNFARELGVRHNLLLYGGAPGWSYSEMNGFGLQLAPRLWFTLYWCGWALLLMALAHRFWIRGAHRNRLTRGNVIAGALALSIVAGAGGFVFYTTNVLHRYETEADAEARHAEYERRYGRYAALAQPSLAATKLQVDFYPSRRAASIRGTYRLENRSAAPIDAIHVATHTGVTTNISFDRAVRAAAIDDQLGHRIYLLREPLQPRQSMQMQFDVVYASRGFTNDGRDESVLDNGSWIEHRGDQNDRERQWLPAIGYQTSRELDNAFAREQHHLAAKPAVRSLDDPNAPREERPKMVFEAIVGTDADQIGVAPGALRRSWSAKGRRYFDYVADAPIGNIYAIFSARYAIHRARWRDVEIEVLHHPAHTVNLGRMIRSVRASLDYGTRTFGPYPHKQLRLVEFPSSGQGLGLTSYPAMIKYSEGYALVRPENDARKIDLPFAVMAHEVAHQWWAHRLVPARVEGAALLTESLAWYTALLVVEETRGRDHLLRLLDIMRSEYLAPHQTREVPLLRASDALDGYRTGPFAMHALRETIGADRVHAALRSLLAKFDPSHPPYATSRDLYAELRAITPAPMQPLLVDLFEEITFWKLQTKKVDVQRAGSAYRVTLHVDAQKLKGNALGKEKAVAMNDSIAVAVFDRDGKTLYRQLHRIHSGAQTLAVTVTREPASAGVDPDHALLDREPEDNLWTRGS